MTAKKPIKPYWQMTTAELREATKQFDEEFVGDRARPLSPEKKARWNVREGQRLFCGKWARWRAAHRCSLGQGSPRALHRALAKKKRLSRDALIREVCVRYWPPKGSSFGGSGGRPGVRRGRSCCTRPGVYKIPKPRPPPAKHPPPAYTGEV